MLGKTFTRLVHLCTPLSPKQRTRQEFLAISLQAHDIAIDCGANVGKITQFLAQQQATIYAFEPNPYAFQVLKDKIHRCSERALPSARCPGLQWRLAPLFA